MYHQVATFQSQPDLKSLHGFALKVNGNVIKFRTEVLKFKTESVCETEFMSIYYFLKKVRFVAKCKLMDFYDVKSGTSELMCDRTAVQITCSENSINRSKRITKKYSIVQELPEEAEINLCAWRVKTRSQTCSPSTS